MANAVNDAGMVKCKNCAHFTKRSAFGGTCAKMPPMPKRTADSKPTKEELGPMLSRVYLTLNDGQHASKPLLLISYTDKGCDDFASK